MSQDPVRLIDDPTAARELRDDLTTVVAIPSTFDVDVGLKRLREATSLPDAPSGPPPGAGRALGAGAKALVGLGLGAAVASAIAVYALYAPRAAVVTPAPHPTVAEPGPHASVPAAPSEPAPSSEVRSIDVSSLPSVRAPSTSIAPLPSVIAAPSAEDGRKTLLQEEIAHLAKLRAGAARDPNEALRLAEEGNRRFYDGMFGQEREAIAVEALVRLGRRDEAKARGAQFLARYPRGPFAERIRRDLELREKP